MIDFSRLITLPFWVNRFPSAISQEFLYGWLAVATLILVAGIAIKVWASRNSDLATQWVSWYYRISRLLVFVSLSSYALLWLRYERIPILSARGWMLLLFVIAVVWAVSIWQQRGAIKESIEKRNIVKKLEKFLPKRKK